VAESSQNSNPNASGAPERATKSVLREWVDAFVFAFVVAAILRAFLFGSYKIPTGSMEKDLLIGDFLSNVAYGARTPMSVCMPFTQWCLPGVQLPWTRLPGFREIKRNDIFVFNVPWEVKPISQKTNYIKRAVGTPGDTLLFRDKVLYVNGEQEPAHDGVQKFHTLVLNEGVRLTSAKMEAIDAGTIGASGRFFQQVSNYEYRVNVTATVAAEIASWAETDTIFPSVIPSEQVVSAYTQSAGNFSKAFNNPDHFGPFVIPFEGQEVTLTATNWPIYKDLIERYEQNQVRTDGGVFVIGRAAVVWMSLNNGIPRVNRFLHFID
jgi:signal peptidase I